MILSKMKLGPITNDIKIGDQTIERVSKIKYWGIIIDYKLTFDEQIRCCTANAASKVNFMCRISK